MMTLKEFIERNITTETYFTLKTLEGNFEHSELNYLEEDRKKFREQVIWVEKQIEKNVKVRFIDVINGRLEISLIETKPRKQRS